MQLRLGSPRFLEEIADFLGDSGKKDSLYHLLEIDEERKICKEVELSGLQDAGLVRYRRRAHLLASALIDEQGNCDSKRIEEILAAWEKGGRIFYPDSCSDEAAYVHVRSWLEFFLREPAAVKKISKLTLPLANNYLEDLVRFSVFLPKSQKITHVDLRRSVMSACFMFLRQSVGSCFATAPAILVHEEKPEYFLADLEEMLFTGRLKRIIEGMEYAVPCSPSMGIGDLKKEISARNLMHSPALRAVFQSLEISVEKLKEYIQLLKKDTVTIGDFFEGLLLHCHKVPKERWASFLNKIGMAPQGLIVVQRDPSQLACEKVEAGIKVARNVFRGFADHPLLKCWEYTVASFSEVKMEFSRWNLYASLGFDAKEPGGIGALFASEIDEKIGKANKEIKDFQSAYEAAFEQVRVAEVLLRNASSEKEIRRLRAEHQSRVHHMRTLLDMRDEAHFFGSGYVSLLEFLFKQYDEKFPQYFQEIYDAEMFDSGEGVYEDGAAGFRLVYKHGRSDPSLWTLIQDGPSYIESLIDFFKMIEPDMMASCPENVPEKEVSRFTDLLIHHLRTEEFLQSALSRMKKAHSSEKLPGVPSEMLSGEKKPWAYISGGTTETLLKTYFRFSGKIHTEGRWTESAEDLLIILLDAIKEVSYQNAEDYRKGKRTRMLIHSPNHAFLLLPGRPHFCEGWDHDQFTYTWVRDELINPSKQFYDSIEMSMSEAEYLIDRFCEGTIAHRWKERLKGQITLKKFIEAADTPHLDRLDAYLFAALPVSSGALWQERVARLIPESLPNFLGKAPNFLLSYELLQAATGCKLIGHSSLQSPIDIESAVLQAALAQKMIAPRIIFADTNWPHYYFAFAWGPATGKLRLWRLQSNGIFGMPMTQWESFLNGKMRLPWAVYTRPEQYS